MRALAYISCTIVCLLCAVMLLRGFYRGGHRLLLWSGVCFIGLTIANLLVFVDLELLANVDLYPLRLIVSVIAMLMLLFGLIWEGE